MCVFPTLLFAERHFGKALPHSFAVFFLLMALCSTTYSLGFIADLMLKPLGIKVQVDIMGNWLIPLVAESWIIPLPLDSARQASFPFVICKALQTIKLLKFHNKSERVRCSLRRILAVHEQRLMAVL